MPNYHDVSSDLSFFYNDAPAAFGYRSSFAGFMGTLATGTHRAPLHPDDSITDGVLLHARRYSDIARILSSLPPRIRRALDATYNAAYRFPASVRVIYGQKAGCALFSPHLLDLNHLQSLSQKKLEKKLTSAEKTLSFQIGDDATKLFETIHQVYLEAKTAYRNQRAIERREQFVIIYYPEADDQD